MDTQTLALATIKKALDYNLRITGGVTNPFGYARQNFLLRGQVREGFFIPHENETGWWWQGENARLLHWPRLLWLVVVLLMLIQATAQ